MKKLQFETLFRRCIVRFWYLLHVFSRQQKHTPAVAQPCRLEKILVMVLIHDKMLSTHLLLTQMRRYSTVTFQTPTKSDFTSENLKADILFLSGHGNADVLSFGTFKFVCQSGTANSNYTNLWNTAKNQKLITFAGCNTAGGDSKNGRLRGLDRQHY